MKVEFNSVEEMQAFAKLISGAQKEIKAPTLGEISGLYDSSYFKPSNSGGFLSNVLGAYGGKPQSEINKRLNEQAKQQAQQNVKTKFKNVPDCLRFYIENKKSFTLKKIKSHFRKLTTYQVSTAISVFNSKNGLIISKLYTKPKLGVWNYKGE